MEKSNISLFDAPEDIVVMPNNFEESSKSEQSKLMSNDIAKAIVGNEVKIIVLPEETDIQYPNYVLDFSDCTEITIFQKEALMNLISKDGDTALYLYNKKSLTRFGYGLKYKLENLMILTKKHIFGDNIKIYRDVQRDKPVDEVISRDITRQRLNL